MIAQDPIEVCITVDTEFSIGGNFDNPAFTPVAEPMVLGPVGGKEQGLGFLLDSLAEFGHRATFFVETLQTAYFGGERMGSIARRIAASGHDVQLHLHPCWLHYEQPEAAKMVPNDRVPGELMPSCATFSTLVCRRLRVGDCRPPSQCVQAIFRWTDASFVRPRNRACG